MKIQSPYPFLEVAADLYHHWGLNMLLEGGEGRMVELYGG